MNRLALWKHSYAMRMMRWLIVREKALQREFMREYHRLGAKGTNYDDNFDRLTCTARPAQPELLRPILQTKIGNLKYELEWVGARLAAWLAATPIEELQDGFATMERAMLDTGDEHFAEWVKHLRDEMFRRSVPGKRATRAGGGGSRARRSR